jgi:hypothetical protein
MQCTMAAVCVHCTMTAVCAVYNDSCLCAVCNDGCLCAVYNDSSLCAVYRDSCLCTVQLYCAVCNNLLLKTIKAVPCHGTFTAKRQGQYCSAVLLIGQQNVPVSATHCPSYRMCQIIVTYLQDSHLRRSRFQPNSQFCISMHGDKHLWLLKWKAF